MKATRIVSVLCALTFPLGLALIANGCGDKEETAPPPPAPAPTPTPTPTPTATMTPEEDAGVEDADAGDADADAPKATGSFDPTGIRACCQALAQNANSAPLDQKPMYLQAAAVCNGLINSPQGKQALIGVRGLLRGANVPAQCR